MAADWSWIDQQPEVVGDGWRLELVRCAPDMACWSHANGGRVYRRRYLGPAGLAFSASRYETWLPGLYETFEAAASAVEGA